MDLLQSGATPEGRARLAEHSGISQTLIMKWVSAVDLTRIRGVSGLFSELLVAAGVASVGSLAGEEPAALHERMVEVNALKNLTGLVPGETLIEQWIGEAKQLPEMVTL